MNSLLDVTQTDALATLVITSTPNKPSGKPQNKPCGPANTAEGLDATLVRGCAKIYVKRCIQGLSTLEDSA